MQWDRLTAHCRGPVADFLSFVEMFARPFISRILGRDPTCRGRIPDEISPAVDHREAAGTVQAQLIEFVSMEEQACYQKFKSEREEQVRNASEALSQIEARKEKYLAMKRRAEMWTPPTPAHLALKKHMLRQLDAFIKYDCDPSPHKAVLESDLGYEEWKMKIILRFCQELEYHVKKYIEELKNVQKGNQWLLELRESLNEFKEEAPAESC